ncbi:hypothetical protein HPB49_008979 [Dermacentor silvarum]|uniref:Uncharacterized protein n=1 Tax=Dermacentor silvarum TaxID=543639 RepID=A0ACB8DYD8_DERSI|nr:hypothetical protein HPB49_008979 [Dermacentor silvarum]
MWFLQAEANFNDNRITPQQACFAQVQSVLPYEIALEVRDVSTKSPDLNPHGALKSAILQRMFLSERRRLQQIIADEELGDWRPTKLLRHMQSLLGEGAACFDENILKQLFLQRLPSSVQLLLATTSGLTLRAPRPQLHNQLRAKSQNYVRTYANFANILPPRSVLHATKARFINNTNLLSISDHSRLPHVPLRPLLAVSKAHPGQFRPAGTITVSVLRQTMHTALRLVGKLEPRLLMATNGSAGSKSHLFYIADCTSGQRFRVVLPTSTTDRNLTPVWLLQAVKGSGLQFRIQEMIVAR